MACLCGLFGGGWETGVNGMVIKLGGGRVLRVGFMRFGQMLLGEGV